MRSSLSIYSTLTPDSQCNLAPESLLSDGQDIPALLLQSDLDPGTLLVPRPEVLV